MLNMLISSHVKISTLLQLHKKIAPFASKLKRFGIHWPLGETKFLFRVKKTYLVSPRGHVISSIYLTNRFHFAVRLFSYRSQMTSKCGKNRKVAHEPLGKRVTDVLSTITITEQTHGKMEYICFIQ